MTTYDSIFLKGTFILKEGEPAEIDTTNATLSQDLEREEMFYLIPDDLITPIPSHWEPYINQSIKHERVTSKDSLGYFRTLHRQFLSHYVY